MLTREEISRAGEALTLAFRNKVSGKVRNTTLFTQATWDYLKDMIFVRPKGQQFWSFEESKQCTQETSCLEDFCPVTAPFKRHC